MDIEPQGRPHVASHIFFLDIGRRRPESKSEPSSRPLSGSAPPLPNRAFTRREHPEAPGTEANFDRANVALALVVFVRSETNPAYERQRWPSVAGELRSTSAATKNLARFPVERARFARAMLDLAMPRAPRRHRRRSIGRVVAAYAWSRTSPFSTENHGDAVVHVVHRNR